LTDFLKIHKYKISLKSVHWTQRATCGGTDGRTDGQEGRRNRNRYIYNYCNSFNYSTYTFTCLLTIYGDVVQFVNQTHKHTTCILWI